MHTFQMMAITLLKNQVAEENVVFYTIMRLVRKGKLRNVNHLTNFKRRLYLRVVVGTAGADPGFCEGGFEGGFVDSLKGTFEQK